MASPIRELCSNIRSINPRCARNVWRGLTDPALTTVPPRSARKQFSEQPLRFRELVVVDLRRPGAIDVEISGIGDAGAVLHEPVMHLLHKNRIIAEIADAPLRKTQGFAMPSGEIAVPF